MMMPSSRRGLSPAALSKEALSCLILQSADPPFASVKFTEMSTQVGALRPPVDPGFGAGRPPVDPGYGRPDIAGPIDPGLDMPLPPVDPGYGRPDWRPTDPGFGAGRPPVDPGYGRPTYPSASRS